MNCPQLRQQVDSYLAELSLLRKPSTENRSRQILYEYLPFAGDDDVRSGVLKYLNWCKEKSNDNHTLENKRVRLRAFYRTQGVTLDVKKIGFAVRKPEIFTPDELDAIYATAKGRELALYRTLHQAGLRKQEAMRLEYDDLIDGGIKVSVHGLWTPKDNEERCIRVPKSLTDMLKALPRIGKSLLVFPTAKGKINHHMLRTLKRTAKRAGVDPSVAWLHKFRANFCTTLMRGGLDIRTIMQQMGHTNLKSTMRYLALLEDETLVDKIEAIWG